MEETVENFLGKKGQASTSRTRRLHALVHRVRGGGEKEGRGRGGGEIMKNTYNNNLLPRLFVVASDESQGRSCDKKPGQVWG